MIYKMVFIDLSYIQRIKEFADRETNSPLYDLSFVHASLQNATLRVHSSVVLVLCILLSSLVTPLLQCLL